MMDASVAGIFTARDLRDNHKDRRATFLTPICRYCEHYRMLAWNP